MPKLIYLDHAATTPCDPLVFDNMKPFFTEKFGNPSSLHQVGRETRAAIDSAREVVARHFNVELSEVIFTSSGTESDTLAICGILEAVKKQDGRHHFITTPVEHKAVFNLAQKLETEGYKLTILKTDEYGLIDPTDLEKAITPDTALVSIGAVNSEIGTRQDLDKIGKICRDKKVYFHTDAVQLVGKEKIDLQKLPVDALSFSSHKFYGPKGVGGLIIRNNVPLEPQLLGGGQEKRRRAATENTPGIIGTAFALELAEKNFDQISEIIKLRDHLIERVLNEIPNSKRNGHPEKNIGTHANFSFKSVEGESLLLRLDMEGICASTGSACSAGSLEPSHILLACGVSSELANSSLRLTLGRHTTQKEIDDTIDALKRIVKDLRELSAL